MKPSINLPTFYFLFFSFFFSSIPSSISKSPNKKNPSSPTQAFISCLKTQSNPSYPISPLIYTPSNSSYSSVLRAYIHNLRYNKTTTPKPQLILTAKHVSHVQAAVICAQSHTLQMKIRSGGHDFEGISYWSINPNFFILDMFNFRSINISVADKSAWVEAGAILGELYYQISQKSPTLGFPAGVCPSIGVGGHVSGGGYGNMMRKYGLTVDNVVDARIVDVNGKILDRKGMGEDMFWAITGGGGASFAVVLAYKINLVQVPKTVTVFSVPRSYDAKFATLIDRYLHVATDKFPKELFLRLTLDVVNGKTRATFLAMFLGNSRDLLTIVNRIFPELGLKRADCVEMSWVKSVLFWMGYPNGTPVNALTNRVISYIVHFKRKSDYLRQAINKGALELLFKKMVEVNVPSMALAFNPHGGKMAEISMSEKPYPHRNGSLAMLHYATDWKEDGEEAEERYMRPLEELYDFMTPYVSMEPREAFLNYRDLYLGLNHNGKNSTAEGAVYGEEYFKGNYERLVNVKTAVDPGNVFQNEQSIPVLPCSK